jgi:hypothetical protein
LKSTFDDWKKTFQPLLCRFRRQSAQAISILKAMSDDGLWKTAPGAPFDLTPKRL